MEGLLQKFNTNGETAHQSDRFINIQNVVCPRAAQRPEAAGILQITLLFFRRGPNKQNKIAKSRGTERAYHLGASRIRGAQSGLRFLNGMTNCTNWAIE